MAAADGSEGGLCPGVPHGAELNPADAFRAA